jgi:hypothetical protein
MNITISIDQRLVKRARERAQAMGKNLNQLLREYIENLAASDEAERDIQELGMLSDRSRGRSGGCASTARRFTSGGARPW